MKIRHPILKFHKSYLLLIKIIFSVHYIDITLQDLKIIFRIRNPDFSKQQI